MKTHIDKLKKRYENLQGQNLPENLTEDYFIRPFLRALGYNSSDPDSVHGQFSADPKDIKGGKVDFALLEGMTGRPIIFVEAKKLDEPLGNHWRQMKRYFNNVLDVSFAILTNGNEFRFYTDLVNPNFLDRNPYLKFRLGDVNEEIIKHLEQFSPQKFDAMSLKMEALALSAQDKIYSFIERQFKSPDDKFVSFVSKSIFGSTRQSVKKSVEKCLPIVFSKLTISKDSDPLPIPDPSQAPPSIRSVDVNIFELSDATGKKIDTYLFQGEEHRGNWKDMYLHVLRHLSRQNPSQLKVAAEKSGVKAFKISFDEELIKHGPESLASGLFTSSNNSSNAKIKFLKIALSAFDLKDALWIKFK